MPFFYLPLSKRGQTSRWEITPPPAFRPKQTHKGAEKAGRHRGSPIVQGLMCIRNPRLSQAYHITFRSLLSPGNLALFLKFYFKLADNCIHPRRTRGDVTMRQWDLIVTSRDHTHRKQEVEAQLLSCPCLKPDLLTKCLPLTPLPDSSVKTMKMYVCPCVCAHVCACVSAGACVHACVCTCVCTYVFLCT